MKKVICIDDDVMQRRYYSLVFKRMRMKLDIYSNPEEALNYLNTINKIDIGLIITDYRMPFINGCELIKRLRSKIKLHIPIIMVTSQNKHEIGEIQSVSNWITKFLNKPVNHIEFQDLILQILN